MPQHKQLSRRNFIKIFAASTVMVGAAGATLKFGVDPSTAQANGHTATATRMLMGTVVNLTILSDDPPRPRPPSRPPSAAWRIWRPS